MGWVVFVLLSALLHAEPEEPKDQKRCIEAKCIAGMTYYWVKGVKPMVISDKLELIDEAADYPPCEAEYSDGT